MKEEYIEDVSAIITSGLSLAVGLGFNVSQEAATILGSCAPIVQRSISRVLTVFNGKSYSRIEGARLGICYDSIVESIRRNEAANHRRNEAFFSQEFSYGKIDEVAEAVLRAAMDDSQNIKARLYGRLLGNALYQTKYDESSLFLLLRIAKQLSFDELCLLAVLNDLPTRNYEALARVDDKRAEILVNMLNLKGLGLVKRMPPFLLGATLDNLQVSAMGKDLYSLMDLQELDSNEVSSLGQLLDTYLAG